MDNILSQYTGAINHFDIKIAISIFLVYILVDGLYAKYTLDVANYNEFRAATTGTTIHFLLAFGIISYTQNWLYIFPLAMGSWFGTFIAVKKARLKKLQRNKIKASDAK